MATGAVRAAPYTGVIWLWRHIEREWRELDGWCTARGIDILTLPCVRGLNLVQYWLTRNAEPETQQKVRAMMTGPLTTTMPPVVVVPGKRRKLPPPWWWGSDEDASRSTMAATVAIRQRPASR